MAEFFFALREEIDTEWIFIDVSYIRAHQHSSGARYGEERATGHSRGGITTKLHIAADAHGYPIHIEITGGEVHDSQVAELMIDKVKHGEYLIADKGYDCERIRDYARNAGMIPIIPLRKNSKRENSDFDWYLYKMRHLVENLFARLKHFRGIATRF